MLRKDLKPRTSLKTQIQNKLGLKLSASLIAQAFLTLKTQIQNKLGLKRFFIPSGLINSSLKTQIQNKLGLKQDLESRLK